MTAPKSLAAALFLGPMIAVALGVYAAKQSATGAQEKKTETGGLLRLAQAKAENVQLENAGKRTEVNFRVVITVEGKDKKATIMETLFNDKGELVQVLASPEAAKVFKAANAGDKIDRCYRRCRHHLDNGEPHKYAACFYACLLE